MKKKIATMLSLGLVLGALFINSAQAAGHQCAACGDKRACCKSCHCK